MNKLQKNKLFRVFLIFIITALWLPAISAGGLRAFAASDSKMTVSLSTDTVETGDSIEVKVNLEGSSAVSAFIIEVEYPSGLTFSSTERSAGVKNGYAQSFDSGSKISFVYTFKSGVPLSPSENILKFRFKVTDGIKGENQFKVTVKGVLDENGDALIADGSVNLSFTANPEKEEVKVTKLTPSSGTLNPQFSPENYNYTMSVPYSVESITFDIEFTGEAKATVNRKNLGSGGSTSKFIITITPEEGDKIIYNVSVTRGEYVRSSTSGSKTATGKTSSASSEQSDSVSLEESAAVGSLEIESGTSKSDTQSSVVILEEPETVNTTTENGFSAFMLGAFTMLIGVAVGLISLLVFKKIKKD